MGCLLSTLKPVYELLGHTSYKNVTSFPLKRIFGQSGPSQTFERRGGGGGGGAGGECQVFYTGGANLKIAILRQKYGYKLRI